MPYLQKIDEVDDMHEEGDPYQARGVLRRRNGFLLWAGVGLTDLGSEAMEISKSFAGIVAAHYPERLYRFFHLISASAFIPSRQSMLRCSISSSTLWICAGPTVLAPGSICGLTLQCTGKDPFGTAEPNS